MVCFFSTERGIRGAFCFKNFATIGCLGVVTSIKSKNCQYMYQRDSYCSLKQFGSKMFSIQFYRKIRSWDFINI